MDTRQTIEYLFYLLDDIDTAGDMAKDNNDHYRQLVEIIQRKRWATGITTNGYTLTIPCLGDKKNG